MFVVVGSLMLISGVILGALDGKPLTFLIIMGSIMYSIAVSLLSQQFNVLFSKSKVDDDSDIDYSALKRIRQGAPSCNVRVRCYHIETRTTTDEEGNKHTQQVEVTKCTHNVSPFTAVHSAMLTFNVIIPPFTLTYTHRLASPLLRGWTPAPS